MDKLQAGRAEHRSRQSFEDNGVGMIRVDGSPYDHRGTWGQESLPTEWQNSEIEPIRTKG